MFAISTTFNTHTRFIQRYSSLHALNVHVSHLSILILPLPLHPWVFLRVPVCPPVRLQIGSLQVLLPSKWYHTASPALYKVRISIWFHTHALTFKVVHKPSGLLYRTYLDYLPTRSGESCWVSLLTPSPAAEATQPASCTQVSDDAPMPVAPTEHRSGSNVFTAYTPQEAENPRLAAYAQRAPLPTREKSDPALDYHFAPGPNSSGNSSRQSDSPKDVSLPRVYSPPTPDAGQSTERAPQRQTRAAAARAAMRPNANRGNCCAPATMTERRPAYRPAESASSSSSSPSLFLPMVAMMMMSI